MSGGGFEPESILVALEREEVRYVVIGGLAAVLHGSPVFTQDVDICPARDRENLERLASALRSIGARIRTEDVLDGLPFACDAQFFEQVDIGQFDHTVWRRGCLLRSLRNRGVFGLGHACTSLPTWCPRSPILRT